jgi:hypothetical protein
MKFFSRVCVTLAVFLSSILPAKADITDGKFSTNQIFDVQYWWSGTTLNASNFIAPYDMNFQHPTVGSGQYFAFFNSTTNPGTYGLGLYNANGTLAQVVHDTGTLQAIGPDALFYVGSGFFGTVITTSAGYNYGQSASFTNMDTSVTSSDAQNYTWASTTPLGAGQTAGGGSPTVVSTASGTPIVTTSSSNGTTTTTVVDTPGTTSVVETVTDTRGTATDTTLTVSRNSTQVSTTPVTRVTTDTTPVTTTTVTTPTTVTTYSDGSTTTTNGTPVTTTSITNQVTTTTTTLNQVTTTNGSQDYTTRIDQYSVLTETNTFNNLLSRNDVLGRQSVVDGTISFKGNVDRTGTISFYSLGEKTGEYSVDGYTVSSKRFGFGLDKLVNPNWIVGLSLARSETVLSGNSASGGLNKDVVTLNSLYNMRNWLFASELGYAYNEYNNSHSLPELGYSNSSNTNGNDRWLGVRLYTPDIKGLRPFAGYRAEQQTRNAVTETGSALTAMSYDAVDVTTKRGEVGVRFDRQFASVAVYGELARTDDNIKIARVGVRKDLSNRVSFIVGATQLQRDDVKSVAGSVVLKIGF